MEAEEDQDRNEGQPILLKSYKLEGRISESVRSESDKTESDKRESETSESERI